MRAGSFAKRYLANLAGLGIENTQCPLLLGRVPDVSVGRGRDVMGMCALREAVDLTFLRVGREGGKAGGECDKAEEAAHENSPCCGICHYSRRKVRRGNDGSGKSRRPALLLTGRRIDQSSCCCGHPWGSTDALVEPNPA